MSENKETTPAAGKADKPKTVKEKLKAVKHKEVILAVLAVAVMLVIYFTTLARSGGGTSDGAKASASDYCAEMQRRVESAVNAMAGAKESKVIINWESGVEAVIAYAINENQNSTSKTPQIVQGGPVVLKEIYPKALGVIVVCANGDNIRLQIEIKDMISTLLSIEPVRIAVYKTKS
ncbi:MAG: hypothetical protein LBH24_07025 [Clostridiales bacterium]|jgi:hypothetical protein|nr:hypothetical protein [Clostridiales bacterium]